MATSSSEEDRKTLTSTTESPSKPQSQPQPQPPPPEEPLSGGYPYPPPYQGYPPQPYPAGYPANNYQYGAQPPPHAFILLGPPQRSQAYKLARVFLVIMIVLFLGMSLMSFLTWLIYGSDIPEFHAESLEMTVIDAKNMASNTTWNANVSVRNPSQKYEVSYDYVEATLVYEDHLLDTDYADPFVLGKKEKRTFGSKFQTPNANQKNIVGATWMTEIENERRHRGEVAFDLRIIVNVVFRRRDYDHTLSRKLKVFCGGMKVVFPSTADTVGRMDDGSKECLILST
ncbi:hypothetical protein ACET3Z_007749 [Daucus carota]